MCLCGLRLCCFGGLSLNDDDFCGFLLTLSRKPTIGLISLSDLVLSHPSFSGLFTLASKARSLWLTNSRSCFEIASPDLLSIVDVDLSSILFVISVLVYIWRRHLDVEK